MDNPSQYYMPPDLSGWAQKFHKYASVSAQMNWHEQISLRLNKSCIEFSIVKFGFFLHLWYRSQYLYG